MQSLTPRFFTLLIAIDVTTRAILPSVAAGEMVRLNARTRIETEPGSGRYHTVTRKLEWSAEKTAIVICDMWDRHWCPGATRRVALMASRMNQVVQAARDKGVLIIHCPSGVTDFYKDTAARRRAKHAPLVETKIPLQAWCHLDPDHEAPLPIDDSDGGCASDAKQRRAWSRQIDTIEIHPEDALTDNPEAFYLMKSRGINNVIVMGVHTNMCVLGRPFSIRQMVYQGQNVVLMRDLTDTMYNPARRPYVSHFTGTDLVVEHIERHWCPSITSADFVGGKEYRFPDDKRPHLVIVMAEKEYESHRTLPRFAAHHLGKVFRVTLVYADPGQRNDLPGIEVLADADVALWAIRRRVLPPAQMDVIRSYLAEGKPLVAIRTSSHAFSLVKGKPPEGHVEWPKFDREILGANYNFHHGNSQPTDPKTRVRVVEGADQHPILKYIPRGEFSVTSWLYRHQPLGKKATLLMSGRVADRLPHEPVAWTHVTPTGGKVFYTMMGHPDEFRTVAFEQLLLNAIHWASDLPAPAKVKTASGNSDVETASNNTGQPDSQWVTLPVPGTWDEAHKGRFSKYDGVGWYRCLVELPDSWTKTTLELFVEKIDDVHEVYFNGVKLGGVGRFPPEFSSGSMRALRYRVDPKLLRSGASNVVAVRVYDHGGVGGFQGNAPALFNERMVIDLSGSWQFRIGDDPKWAEESVKDSQAKMVTFARIDRAADIIPRVVDEQNPAGGLSPAESATHFEVVEGLELQQLLSEPLIAQPLDIDFDERGRLWLVEYRQYPHPAGLNMLSRDNHWRAVFDKVPPAPPNHFRGKDRISIHEDTDGDGKYDHHKIFVEGLNITTSLARGRGGVWVLNPPYLLFYSDRNGDDVPDGNPEVHLSGFGLEDTHAVANSLRWGPDGWLYGCQGSTVTAAIVRPGTDHQPVNSMGQLIWRYHPETRRYEIFAEGGGNAFGCEVDSQGRVFSGHNGGNTRGFHYVQGGYYRKGFEKHGALSNPYSFGYFPAMTHHDVPRFTHTFVIYDGKHLPMSYHGKLFGVEPLKSQIVLSEVMPDHSSFKTRDIMHPVTSRDQSFRPVNIKAGPDGALYIADWYDRYVSHYRNHEGKIDPHSGRVYRLQAAGAKPAPRFDLSQRSSAELVGLLANSNKWFRQAALRLLADRSDSSVVPLLEQSLRSSTGQLALESLWALHLSGGFTESLALELLGHADPQVRAWTVRLLGDRRQVSSAVARRLADLAREERQVEVRSQLACSARRLPADDGLPIVGQLLGHQRDVDDIHMPLLIWWAIEAHAEKDRNLVVELFRDAGVWQQPIVFQHLAERIMRRYAQAGSRQDLLSCTRLFEFAPNKEVAGRMLAGFEKAYEGRTLGGIPDQLLEAMIRVAGDSLALRLRRGDADAIQQALKIIADDKAAIANRIQYAQIMGQIKAAESVTVLLRLLRITDDAGLRGTLIASLQAYDVPEIGEVVIELHGQFNDDVRTIAHSLLASRRNWARKMIDAVDAGKIEPHMLSPSVLRKVLRHNDQKIKERVQKHWGQVAGATTDQIKAEILRLEKMIRDGYGSPYRGKAVYREHCGKCHVLFDDGGQIGPDLTSYQRDDLSRILLNVVNPSAEIREGFENYVLQTEDGRTLNGFISEQDNRSVTLRGIDGQSIILDREEIIDMRVDGQSLMPEGILKPLSDTQTRDLFAYLRSTQPLNF